jgi:ATP-dependent RNA helicase DeaD
MKKTTFAEFELSEAVTAALTQLGYGAPTPVQAEAIGPLLEGRDVIAQAQTGTGKTAAFGIPIAERAEPRLRKPQVLVLVPTRELAMQVAGALYGLVSGRGLSVLPVYGGQPYERQLRGLRNGAQIVVGTPGRVKDHLKRGTLELAKVGLCVLDEADEMLNMGFLEEMEEILAALREARGDEESQTALFSATLPPRIRELAKRFLKDPVRVDVGTGQVTVAAVTQVAYEIGRMEKGEALSRVLDAEAPESAIVFCATRKNVDDVALRLASGGRRVGQIHGDMAQRERERVMRGFRDGQTDLLVATDVASRGLDVEGVTHVINYDVPWDPESYVHRIGRTARAGRTGDAITLVAPRDVRALRNIEAAVRVQMDRKRLPTHEDVAARRRGAAKAAVVMSVLDEGLEPYLSVVSELAGEHEPLRLAAAALRLWDQAKNPEAGGQAPAGTGVLAAVRAGAGSVATAGRHRCSWSQRSK